MLRTIIDYLIINGKKFTAERPENYCDGESMLSKPRFLANCNPCPNCSKSFSKDFTGGRHFLDTKKNSRDDLEFGILSVQKIVGVSKNVEEGSIDFDYSLGDKLTNKSGGGSGGKHPGGNMLEFEKEIVIKDSGFKDICEQAKEGLMETTLIKGMDHSVLGSKLDNSLRAANKKKSQRIPNCKANKSSAGVVKGVAKRPDDVLTRYYPNRANSFSSRRLDSKAIVGSRCKDPQRQVSQANRRKPVLSAQKQTAIMDETLETKKPICWQSNEFIDNIHELSDTKFSQHDKNSGLFNTIHHLNSLIELKQQNLLEEPPRTELDRERETSGTEMFNGNAVRVSGYLTSNVSEKMNLNLTADGNLPQQGWKYHSNNEPQEISGKPGLLSDSKRDILTTDRKKHKKSAVGNKS